MSSIKDLSAACLYSTPRTIDWSECPSAEEADSPSTTWRAYSFEACETCGALIPMTEGAGGESHDSYEDTPCKGHVPLFEGPMMNYWYPIDHPGITVDSAMQLSGPLCLVRVGDEWGLALTGGGMDLSWEIVENFVRLGFLPPIHFADLPQMCGRGSSVKDKRLLAACRTSVIIGIRHLRGKLRSIASTKQCAEDRANGVAR